LESPDLPMPSQAIEPKTNTKSKRHSKPFLYMKEELQKDGLRIFRDSSIQGYPHNHSNSCWFDSSLEALFFCFLQMGHSNFEMNAPCDQSSKLKLLAAHLEARKTLYQTAERISDLQVELGHLRNKLASDLNLNILEVNNPLVHFNFEWY